MKTIYLIRHAKSSWASENVDDIDRSLKDRGIADAYEMATRLDGKKKPQLVLCSPAARTLHTSSIFMRTWNLPTSILRVEYGIYYNNFNEENLSILESLDDEIDTVAFVGHNPGIHEFANYLAKEGPNNFPTCSVAIIKIESDSWKSLSKNGSLEFLTMDS